MLKNVQAHMKKYISSRIPNGIVFPFCKNTFQWGWLLGNTRKKKVIKSFPFSLFYIGTRRNEMKKEIKNGTENDGEKKIF